MKLVPLQSLRTLLLGLLLVLSAARVVPSAELPYDFIEVAAVDLNPDYSRFENGQGFSLAVSKTLSSIFFVDGRYTKAHIRVGGDIQGREITDWWHLGMFLRNDLTSRFHVVGGVALQGTKLAGDNESGFSVQLGLRSLPFERVEVNVSIGYLDLVIEDFQTIIEANYRLTENLSIGVRIRDYADWDYSSYEGGVRYNF